MQCTILVVLQKQNRIYCVKRHSTCLKATQSRKLNQNQGRSGGEKSNFFSGSTMMVRGLKERQRVKIKEELLDLAELIRETSQLVSLRPEDFVLQQTLHSLKNREETILNGLRDI